MHRDALIMRNATDLRNHSGPFFEHWRRAMAASVGAVLPSDADAG